MNIKDFRIYQYNLDLNDAVAVHDQQLRKRKGLVIHLTSEQGAQGFGEAAPLPGFSDETFIQARDQVRLLKSKLTGQTIPEGLTKFNGQFQQWLDPFQLKPSVRFGFESAVLHLLANTRQVSVYELIPEVVNHQIHVTGLLSGSRNAIVDQAKTLINQGFTELKLKVGGPIEEDIEKVQAVNAVANEKALVHLDANQQWDFDQALAFAKAVGAAAASYIEEPFKDISRIPEFYDETLIPIALDESLTHLTLDEISGISGVETIILKPTILGGIEKTLQLMTQAENFALDAVISSSFESSLGIWTLANMVETSSHHTAAGLDTLKWFKQDLLKAPIQFQNGTLEINRQTCQPDNINFDLLKTIE